MQYFYNEDFLQLNVNQTTVKRIKGILHDGYVIFSIEYSEKDRVCYLSSYYYKVRNWSIFTSKPRLLLSQPDLRLINPLHEDPNSVEARQKELTSSYNGVVVKKKYRYYIKPRHEYHELKELLKNNEISGVKRELYYSPIPGDKEPETQMMFLWLLNHPDYDL